MTTTPSSNIASLVADLSTSVRRRLDMSSVLTSDLRALGSSFRGAGTGPSSATVGNEDINQIRALLKEALARLRAQIAVVLAERASSELKAERLFVVVGGLVVLLLLGLFLAAMFNRETPFDKIFSGASAAALLAMLLGPGREIRRAAKDRTALMLIPELYEMRVLAATTAEDLKAVAAELETTVRSLAWEAPSVT